MGVKNCEVHYSNGETEKVELIEWQGDYIKTVDEEKNLILINPNPQGPKAIVKIVCKKKDIEESDKRVEKARKEEEERQKEEYTRRAQESAKIRVEAERRAVAEREAQERANKLAEANPSINATTANKPPV